MGISSSIYFSMACNCSRMVQNDGRQGILALGSDFSIWKDKRQFSLFDTIFWQNVRMAEIHHFQFAQRKHIFYYAKIHRQDRFTLERFFETIVQITLSDSSSPDQLSFAIF